MMGHILAEASALLRHRALVSLALGLALAVPLALGGLTLCLDLWLAPLVSGRPDRITVEILLHPDLSPEDQARWIETTAAEHPEWEVREVPPGELAARLARWFPYLKSLMDESTLQMVPALVEITTAEPTAVENLREAPEVLAVGPTEPVTRLLRRAGLQIRRALALVSLALVLGAGLLASVWTHLEMYRHADEITIMRLVGATEGAVRGPFLAAITVTGLLAGLLGAAATWALVHWAGSVASTVGLARPPLPLWILAAQVLVGVTLPLLTAWAALARHADLELT